MRYITFLIVKLIEVHSSAKIFRKFMNCTAVLVLWISRFFASFILDFFKNYLHYSHFFCLLLNLYLSTALYRKSRYYLFSLYCCWQIPLSYHHVLYLDIQSSTYVLFHHQCLFSRVRQWLNWQNTFFTIIAVFYNKI